MRWSLCFKTPAEALDFARHVAAARYESMEEKRVWAAVDMQGGLAGQPTLAAGDILVAKFAVFDASKPGTAMGETPVLASDDGDADSLLKVRLNKTASELKAFSRALVGKAAPAIVVVALDAETDDSGLELDASIATRVYRIELVEVDKRGAKYKRDLSKGHKRRAKKAEREKEKAAKEAERAEARAKEEADARKKAAELEARKKTVEAERAQLSGVTDALRDLYSVGRDATEFEKKRSLADIKDLMGQVYGDLTAKFAADESFTGEQIAAELKVLMRETTKRVAVQIRDEPRDEVARLVEKGTTALRTEVEAVVKATRAERDEIVAAKVAAAVEEKNDEVMRLMGTVEKLMAQVDALEAEKKALSADAAQGSAKSEQVTALEDKVAQLTGVCDQFSARIKEVQAELDEREDEVEDLRAELDDLEKLQGQKLTWVPDNVVKQCVSCEAGFGLKTRRHHCRYCGRVFCAKCTKTTRAIPALGFTSPVRVCEPCDGILAQQ